MSCDVGKVMEGLENEQGVLFFYENSIHLTTYFLNMLCFKSAAICRIQTRMYKNIQK